MFGVNVTLRHPHKIAIGDNVVVDDQCCLDAKGTDNRGIVIGSGVFVGRNTILSCKNGDIVLEDRANLGFNCEIFSASTVRVGSDVLMAAYTYLVGGDHLYDRTDIPVLQQGRTARGIDVGAGAWLGAHVVVTDGSTVGRDAIIGAGAVVVGAIPEFAIAVGTPAKVIRDRRAEGAAEQPQPPAPSPQPLVMCGIAGIVDRDLGAPIPEAELAGMVRALAHRGPDGDGRGAPARRRARHAAPGDRRRRHRPAADRQRDRHGAHRRQRRDLQLPRAAAGTARAAATRSAAWPRTSRCWCTATRNGARRCRRRSAAWSPSRFGTAHPDAVRRPRPRRREAALLDADRRAACCWPRKSRRC